MNIFKFSIVSCALMIWIAISSFSFAQTPAHKKILFSCGATSPDNPLYKTVEATYRQAFAQMGYEFSMITSPNLKRSLAEARYGGSDGDCGRLKFLNDLIPNSHLIRVDVKVLETSLSAWSYNPNLHINSAEAIKADNLSLGYTRGALIVEHYLSQHPLPQAQIANTPETAIKMLLAKRFDLLIISSDIMAVELKRLQLEGKLHNVGVLERYDVYPYLNERHKALLPQLERELTKIIPEHGLNPASSQQTKTPPH